jgi:RNA polymerase sigma-70 factor, ECF subfamily
MGFDQLPTDAQSLATSLIRRKSRELATHENFTPSDQDDIAQDLWLWLIEKLDCFDPERGTIFAFIATIVDRKAASILRHHRAAKRDTCRCRSLSLSIRANDGTYVELASTITEDASDARLGKRTWHPQYRTECELDLTTVLESLSDEDRELCERLMTQSLSEVARDMEVPRSTLQDRINRLRQQFTDLQGYL